MARREGPHLQRGDRFDGLATLPVPGYLPNREEVCGSTIRDVGRWLQEARLVLALHREGQGCQAGTTQVSKVLLQEEGSQGRSHSTDIPQGLGRRQGHSRGSWQEE